MKSCFCNTEDDKFKFTLTFLVKCNKTDGFQTSLVINVMCRMSAGRGLKSFICLKCLFIIFQFHHQNPACFMFERRKNRLLTFQLSNKSKSFCCQLSPHKKRHSESLLKVIIDVISINNSTEKTPDLAINTLSYILNYRKNLYWIPISLKNKGYVRYTSLRVASLLQP